MDVLNNQLQWRKKQLFVLVTGSSSQRKEEKKIENFQQMRKLKMEMNVREKETENI